MLGVLLGVLLLWIDGCSDGSAAQAQGRTLQAQGRTPPAGFARAAEAVSKGDLTALRELLISLPELAKSRDSEARTLLHIAAQRDRADIATLLLDAGADPIGKDARGESALETCLGVYAYRGKVAELLVGRGAASVLTRERQGQLLHRGAANGQAAMVGSLLESGVDPRATSPNGGSLLHSAAAGGLEPLARTLVDRGLPLDGRDRYGLTPLHYAAAYGRPEVVSLLLERGATIDAADSSGRTAFHLATLYGHEPTTKLLGSRGASKAEAVYPGAGDQYLGARRPLEEPLLFAPGVVSTFEWEHGAPSFSPDGKTLLWTTCLHTMSGCSVLEMTRTRDGWSPPHLAPFTSAHGESYPRFSPDGRTIFFNSYRPLDTGSEPEAKTSRSNRLWMVSKTDSGWSGAVPLRLPSGRDLPAFSASLSAGGRLYFSMYREDGSGGFDVYVSRYGDGRVSEPKPVPGAVNTKFDESVPYVTPDERIMIFASGDRPQNLGLYDMYVSVRGADGRWSTPHHLDPPINGPGLNWLPSMSADGRYFFFSSSRNGNIGDVYWVDAGVLAGPVRPAR